jgi:hypothetical protein
VQERGHVTGRRELGDARVEFCTDQHRA